MCFLLFSLPANNKCVTYCSIDTYDQMHQPQKNAAPRCNTNFQVMLFEKKLYSSLTVRKGTTRSFLFFPLFLLSPFRPELKSPQDLLSAPNKKVRLAPWLSRSGTCLETCLGLFLDWFSFQRRPTCCDCPFLFQRVACSCVLFHCKPNQKLCSDIFCHAFLAPGLFKLPRNK